MPWTMVAFRGTFRAFAEGAGPLTNTQWQRPQPLVLLGHNFSRSFRISHQVPKTPAVFLMLAASPAGKRRKVAESCRACRTKKTRCDGLHPCSSCKSKAIHCDYNEAAVLLQASTLANIESRLQKLEQNVSSQAQTEVAVDDGTPQQTRLDRPEVHSDSYLSQVDSSSRFIGDISRMAEAISGREVNNSVAESEAAWTSEPDSSSMVFPPRRISDELLKTYQRHVSVVFPILNMVSFRTKYEELWRKSTPEQPTPVAVSDIVFYAMLNMVFALGSLNTPNAEPRAQIQVADVFYRRARRLVQLESLDASSLEAIQYCLLTASYLLSTKYTNRCHTTLAVAIRYAQLLNLHDDTEIFNNQLKRELGKRLWHLSLTMDR